MSELSQRLVKRGILLLARVAPGLAIDLSLRIFTTPVHHQRPEWEQALIATGRPRTIAGLSTTEWGQDGDPIVLLVHGWSGRGSQLARLADPLVSKGFHVFAVDGPAHGDSPGKTTNAYAFAKAIHAVADELGRVHGIVAHSFGAGAALIAFSEGLRVRCACLVASPSDLRKVIDGFCQQMGFDARLSERFRRRISEHAGISIDSLDVATMVRDIAIPALIAHDPKDRQVSFASAERIVAMWPSARLLALSGVGHFRILKSSEFVAAVLDFFTQLPLAPK